MSCVRCDSRLESDSRCTVWAGATLRPAALPLSACLCHLQANAPNVTASSGPGGRFADALSVGAAAADWLPPGIFSGDGTAFSEAVPNSGKGFACSYRYLNDWASTHFAAMNSKQVRCGAVRCGAVRCGAVRCDAVRCGALQFGERGGAALSLAALLPQAAACLPAQQLPAHLHLQPLTQPSQSQPPTKRPSPPLAPAPQWDNGNACGRCITAWCDDERCPTRGKRVQVLIADKCPECAHGDVDFSIPVYRDITGMWPHRLRISWEWSDCSDNMQGGIRLDPKVSLRGKGCAWAPLLGAGLMQPGAAQLPQ